MNLRKYNLLIILTLFFTFVFGLQVSAQFEEFIDPQIPESWYEAPQSASEVGITEFSQSSMLDERVEQGELPPVEQRLPDDPPVIEPLEGVGKHGGTANVFGTDLSFGSDARYLELGGAAGRATPDGSDVVPFMVKDWEYSEDATEFTIHLREGLKYSDGSECTADDYVFWWEHEAQNQDIQPVPPEEWKPVPLIDVVKEDEYTVTFKYGSPNPNNHRFNGQMGTYGSWSLRPADFLKQIHPDYIGMEEAEELADSVDLDRWDEYFSRIRDDSISHPEYEMVAPTLRAYIPVERTETMLLLERNPYYPFVDTEGNQLPYIDRIRINLANSREMAATKATTGEATLGGRYTNTYDIPLYKRNEEKEDYTTLVYYRSYGGDVIIQPNHSHKEPEMREILSNVKFRKALSLAIDRKDISQKVYYDQATPRQFTVPPMMGDFFKPEYADTCAEFDPERAEELLDEIGMVDQDGDGYRDTPEGNKFNPILIFNEDIGPVNPGPVLELIDTKWQDIGLDVEMKLIDRSLRSERVSGNNMDMTVWTGDNILLTFGAPGHMAKYLAPLGNPGQSTWPAYSNWYTTGGEEGIEPPQKIKQLIEWGEDLGYDPDPEKRLEAGRKLMESQAENLWTIGTVGMAPQPIIASNELKNIPENGLWDWAVRYMRPMYPIQFYLDE